MRTKWSLRQVSLQGLEQASPQSHKSGTTNEPSDDRRPRTANGKPAATEGDPQTRGRNWWLDIPLHCAAEFRACSRRVCSWCTPPNWGQREWFEEICAVAAAAAWEAETGFDPAYGISMGAFVRYRVLGRALTRYRQEWAFARRCIREPAEEDNRNTAGKSQSWLAPISHDNTVCDTLLEALAGIGAPSSWLIEQLFWDERTQAEIGREQGLSQRAISKRKQAVLRTLRQRLNNKVAKAWRAPSRAERSPSETLDSSRKKFRKRF